MHRSAHPRRLGGLLLAASAWLAGCGGAAAGGGGGPSSSAAAGESQACVACHGELGSAAPPRTTRGETATTALGVGAHATHLYPGPFGKAVACDECHRVPRVAGDPGHGDGTVDVVFGPVAATGSAQPQWNRATATCSGTYCHGATLTGGTRTAPRWTHVVRDAANPDSEVYCGGCHANPPDVASGHPKVDASIPGYTSAPNPAAPATLAVCATCHPDTVRPDGTLDVEGGRHIDGVLQIGAYACARCHGDAADTSRAVDLRPAPPRGNHGETAVTDRAVGAHAIHLQGLDLTADPVHCSECHAVPTSMRDHPNPAYSATNRAVDMTWGPLATAGGAVPAWSGDTLTCAGTYCHGSTLVGGQATAPRWTLVDGSQRKCTSCHGVPPATAAHAQDATTNPDPADCGRCHAGYTSTAVVKATHIDGLVNVNALDSAAGQRTCTSCHGDSRRAGNQRAAPPVAINGATSTSSPGVGAHLVHVTEKHLSARPVACSECHPAELRTDHAAANGYGVRMQWGALARTGQSYPQYDEATFTCSNTYCHGSTLAGGTNRTPVWTQVAGGPEKAGSQTACGSCHGIPPPAPHVASLDCGTCHAGYTSQTVNLALHLDGEVNVSGGACTSCHGDPSRSPASAAAAPPAEARVAGGGTPPWAGDGASKAHLSHLVAGPLGPAVACRECHTVPGAAPQGGSDTHGDGKATVVFGAFTRTGGATPAFDAATATCSGTYCHGATLSGGTVKVPVWTRTDGTQSACGACHAVPPADATHGGVASGVSCGDCHRGYGGVKGGAAGSFTVNTALHLDGVVDVTGGTCTTCHGTSGRRGVAGADAQLASAPPADAKGFTAAGAHLAHLSKATGAIAPPVACGECHQVPTAGPKGGSDTHGDGLASVTFGALARTDGASPRFDATSLACSNTYCHGATLSGGTNKAPLWSATGATAAGCGICHGLPPATAPHTSGSTACGSCHPGYTATTVNATTHVDGTVQANGLSCTSCHGDATRASGIAAAPPKEAAAPAGGTAPWAGDGASGAHLKHLVAGALGPAVACAECHAVPTTAPKGGTDPHGDGKATLSFGSFSRKGGASPSFSAATVTCSGTYCHGASLSGGTAKTPVWTRTDGSQVTCTSCHGNPPADAAHNGLATGAACRSCHTGYGGTKGGTSFTVNKALHLNGAVDATAGTCTSCHGTEGRSLVTGADPRTASAPPLNAANLNGAGAHLAHLNKGALGKKLACAECHTVPSSGTLGGTHGNGRADVVFGNLSRAGGRNPSFNGTTCSNTYCHGNAAPRWDATGLSCTSCHANPPNDACHTFRHEASGGRCNGCHRNVNSSGNGISNPAQHVDGITQGQCSECHRGNVSCTNRGDD